MSAGEDPKAGAAGPATGLVNGAEPSALRADELAEEPGTTFTARFLAASKTGHPVLLTALAMLIALFLCALLIIFTDQQVLHSLTYFFSVPGDFFRYSWQIVSSSYSALFTGAIFSPGAFSTAFSDPTAANWEQAFYPLSQSIADATPLILAGLAVALSFRSGLFNIGAEGQLFAGALAAGFVGFEVPGLTIWVHLPLAILAGIAGGALVGFIPGILKARTGAHEVITTIMLNYIVINFALWLLTDVGIFRPPGATNPISKAVAPSARLPKLPGSLLANAAFILALAAAYGVFWLLYRSTLGFEFRAVGANPNAARTAGISVSRTIVLVMTISGGLAGLAGAGQILGVAPTYQLVPDYSAGLGFTAITVALLGRSSPGGVVLAGLLFGMLEAGGTQMQASAGTSVDLVQVLQALIVLFVAAPLLVRAVFRIKAGSAGPGMVSSGWGA